MCTFDYNTDVRIIVLKKMKYNVFMHIYMYLYIV